VLDFIQVNFGGSIVFNKATLAHCLVIKAKPAVGKLLSIFATHSLRGVKRLDYRDACKVYSLMVSRQHLTPTGLAMIRVISEGMNQRRPIVRTLSFLNLYKLYTEVKDKVQP